MQKPLLRCSIGKSHSECWPLLQILHTINFTALRSLPCSRFSAATLRQASSRSTWSHAFRTFIACTGATTPKFASSLALSTIAVNFLPSMCWLSTAAARTSRTLSGKCEGGKLCTQAATWLGEREVSPLALLSACLRCSLLSAGLRCSHCSAKFARGLCTVLGAGVALPPCRSSAPCRAFPPSVPCRAFPPSAPCRALPRAFAPRSTHLGTDPFFALLPPAGGDRAEHSGSGSAMAPITSAGSAATSRGCTPAFRCAFSCVLDAAFCGAILARDTSTSTASSKHATSKSWPREPFNAASSGESLLSMPAAHEGSRLNERTSTGTGTSSTASIPTITAESTPCSAPWSAGPSLHAWNSSRSLSRNTAATCSSFCAENSVGLKSATSSCNS
mmetsp:Transcript_57865/g.134807  ORF Transcript_57865/g.134807 Transcript_57865/m.134807 type:complete len:389 (-) Transcript_57865:1506-2672(-)